MHKDLDELVFIVQDQCHVRISTPSRLGGAVGMLNLSIAYCTTTRFPCHWQLFSSVSSHFSQAVTAYIQAVIWVFMGSMWASRLPPPVGRRSSLRVRSTLVNFWWRFRMFRLGGKLRYPTRACYLTWSTIVSRLSVSCTFTKPSTPFQRSGFLI